MPRGGSRYFLYKTGPFHYINRRDRLTGYGGRPFFEGRGQKMSQMMPEGEEIRKAIKWISDNLEEGKTKSKLIEEAALKYDLSPAQTDFLINFFSKKKA